MLARKIIADALVDLQDPNMVRWPAAELVSALNDGQRQVVELDHEALTVERTLTLVAGVTQSLPTDAMALLDVPANAAPSYAPIRQVARELLDASAPGWRRASPRPLIEHFVHDPRVPRVFAVYPPAVPGTQVQAVLCLYPAYVPEPDDNTLAAIAGDIGLADEYGNALRHYVLFRAWSKDAEYGGNAALASQHMNLFFQAIGAKTMAEDSSKPSTATDPTQ